MIKLRILAPGDKHGLSGWAQGNHKGPYKRKRRMEAQRDVMMRAESERLEDATLLVLKMEEEGTTRKEI